MDPRIRERIDSLESLLGSAAVVQILEYGIDAYSKDVAMLSRYTSSVDSPFGQRVTEMVRAKDPDASWKFEQKPDGGLQIIIQGRLGKDFEADIHKEFDKLFDALPGLREKLPGLSLRSRVEPVEEEPES
jgi:hypothetical protein